MGVLNSEEWFVKAPDDDGTQVNVPQTVGCLLERDVVFGEHVSDVHPVVVPADAAVVTDTSDLPVRGMLERWTP